MKNHWDERFQSETYVYGEEPNGFIESSVDYIIGKNRIVAFAEGEGRNAVFLARKGFEVTAWDYAANGLKKTKQLASRHNVQIQTAQVDLIQDSIPVNEFDAAFMVFGHFPKEHQQKVFNKLFSTVRPGGII